MKFCYSIKIAFQWLSFYICMCVCIYICFIKWNLFSWNLCQLSMRSCKAQVTLIFHESALYFYSFYFPFFFYMSCCCITLDTFQAAGYIYPVCYKNIYIEEECFFFFFCLHLTQFFLLDCRELYKACPKIFTGSTT